MSVIIVAIIFLCGSLAIAATVGAICLPKFRVFGLIIAGLGFACAFVCTAFFVLVVGQMN